MDTDFVLRRIDRTFAFIDLSGFTAFSEKAGDDQAVDVLVQFRNALRNIASKRGVRIAKWLGDGVMLVGVEPEETVDSVLEINSFINDSDFELSVRAGIAGGWVLLIEGDDHVGRELILASRLCDSAGPGQVLAPKELVSPLMNLTQIELGEVMVEGFAKPFQLVQLEQAE